MADGCKFPGCTCKHFAYGHCQTHRRQSLAGEVLTPLPGREPINKGKICSFVPCGRAARTKGMCLGHYGQLHRGEELRPISSGRTQSERWAAMTPEEKAKRLAPMRQGQMQPRTEEHARRISESLRARYAVEPLKLPDSRSCRGCGREFRPNSGSHFYCEVPCRALTYRLKRFGMSRAEWNRLASDQDGRCALCGHRERGWNFGVGLVIDHCHKTGRPRGLLCGDCNTAIGRFGDDADRLRAAADYLDRYST